MNCREHSAIAPEFNPVNHVKRRTRDGSESLGEATRYLDLTVARPVGLEPTTSCLEVA